MRRTTLILTAALIAGCAHAASAPRGSGASTANAPMLYQPASAADRELLPDEQIQQVLNRLAYGGRPGDMSRVRAMGVDKWIQRQLHPESIRDDNTDKMMARYASLSVPTDELLRGYQVVQQAQRQQKAATAADSGQKRDARVAVAATMDPQTAQMQQMNQRVLPELQAASLSRAVMTERQLDEVMVNFWLNHFNVYAQKGPQERILLTEYDRDIIRPNALGKFRDLLGAVAHSPAMLFYLDNWQSQADSVHPTLTCGVGGNGRGANAAPPPARAAGRGNAVPPMIGNLPPEVQRQLALATPEQQNCILRQLAARRANPQQRQRPGLNENYGRELLELHTLGVDGGYTQKDVIEVARALTGWTIAMGQGGAFIFRPESHDAGEKLILGHKFPANRGQEEGEEVLDIVAHQPATAKFIATKLARHFVMDDPSPALVDRCADIFTKSDGDIRQTVGCVVTSPEFFSRAAYRAKVKTPFQVVASALRAVQAEPDATPRSAQAVTQLGQPIYGRLTPDGWPDRGDAWMNTGAILGRINFGLMLAGGRVPGVTLGTVPELDQLKNASREAQVDGVVKLLFGGQVSPDTREILLTGENPLATTLTPDSVSMDMGAAMAPPVRRPNAAAAAAVGGGRGQVRPNANNQPVSLTGLAQVIGLALGAPEFQRR